jgi:hypothetical protein
MAFTNGLTERTTGYLVTADDWNYFVKNSNAIGSSARINEVGVLTAMPSVTVNPAAGEWCEGTATPKVGWYQWRFDGATIEALQWTFRCPANYGSALSFAFGGYAATATVGTIVMEGYIATRSNGDAGSLPAFGTVTAATVVSAGVGTMFGGTITFTDVNGMAAGDKVILHVQRNGTTTADNMGGDFCMDSCELKYQY